MTEGVGEVTDWALVGEVRISKELYIDGLHHVAWVVGERTKADGTWGWERLIEEGRRLIRKKAVMWEAFRDGAS